MQATAHPALIRHEVAGNPRRHPRIPARPSSKNPARGGIPAYTRSARNRQDRPVTPEVAGSSPVAPVETPCKDAYFVVASENVIARSGSKRSKLDGRGAVIGAEADANLPR